MSPSPASSWTDELRCQYESNAANQFIIYGNVHDRFPINSEKGIEFGDLTAFLSRILLGAFEVVLTCDLGNGIRVLKGSDIVAKSPVFDVRQEWPKAPRPAVEALTRYFRYAANLGRVGQTRARIACLLQGAEMMAPAGYSANDVSAIALLIREWAADPLLTEHPLATFLITDSLADLHPLL